MFGTSWTWNNSILLSKVLKSMSITQEKQKLMKLDSKNKDKIFFWAPYKVP